MLNIKEQNKLLIEALQEYAGANDPGSSLASETLKRVKGEEDPKYPQCEKLSELSHERDTLLNFITFLEDQDIALTKWHEAKVDWGDSQYHPIHDSEDELIMQFLKIDPKELEKERQAIIADLTG